MGIIFSLNSGDSFQAVAQGRLEGLGPPSGWPPPNVKNPDSRGARGKLGQLLVKFLSQGPKAQSIIVFVFFFQGQLSLLCGNLVRFFGGSGRHSHAGELQRGGQDGRAPNQTHPDLQWAFLPRAFSSQRRSWNGKPWDGHTATLSSGLLVGHFLPAFWAYHNIAQCTRAGEYVEDNNRCVETPRASSL